MLAVYGIDDLLNNRRGAFAGLRRPTVGPSLVGAGRVRARGAARVEKLGELRVRHLVALEPEGADVHAMQRRLVRTRVVAAHPERA